MTAVQVNLFVHLVQTPRVDFQRCMCFLFHPLAEYNLEVGAGFLQLRPIEVSALIEVELRCVSA